MSTLGEPKTGIAFSASTRHDRLSALKTGRSQFGLYDRRCDFCEFSTLFFNTPQLTNSRLPFATNAMDNVVADGFTRDVSKQISELPAAQFADGLKNDVM